MDVPVQSPPGLVPLPPPLTEVVVPVQSPPALVPLVPLVPPPPVLVPLPLPLTEVVVPVQSPLQWTCLTSGHAWACRSGEHAHARPVDAGPVHMLGRGPTRPVEVGPVEVPCRACRPPQWTCRADEASGSRCLAALVARLAKLTSRRLLLARQATRIADVAASGAGRQHGAQVLSEFETASGYPISDAI